VKLAIEKYLELFHIEHGLDFVALRLANPYGPGQSFRRSQGFIVPSLLEKIGKGEELTIFGDGTDSRDYVYISDVVDAFHKSVLLNSPVAQTINVGGGAHYSVNELVEEIETALGRPVPRQHLDRRGSDIPRSFLEVSKAKIALGWSPQVSLSEGIKRVLDSEGIV
jgi:UDP-glucose 4-epimerase